MFQTKFVDKIKTHILYSVTFLENRAIYVVMWKNTVESDRGHDDMAHPHCLLDA